MSVDRRDFLKGAVAASGMAAMGGVSTAFAEEAVANFGMSVPANLEYEQKILSLFPNAQPISPVDVPEAWDAEYDVVIVGSGAAGLAAAMRLQEKGKSACVVEKMVIGGGNSQYSSYFKCFGGTKLHEANGLGDYQAYRATVPAVVDAMYEDLLHQSKSKSFLTTALVDSPRAMDWLMEDMGCELTFDKAFAGGTGEEGGDTAKLTWRDDSTDVSSARNYYALMHMLDKAQELGAKVCLETECKTLVVEGDAVVGIKVVDPSGAELYLKGNEGVILAGGGCIDNPDMTAVFMPTLARVGGSSMTNGSDTGECIRMGMGVGAAVAGRDSFTGNDGGPAWEIHGARNFNLYGGWTQVGGQPWMTMDRYGELQTYYSTSEFGEMANLKQDRLEFGQQGYRVYKIIDSKYADYVETFGQQTWRIPLVKGTGIERFPGLTDWREGMDWAIESGTLPQADSLEELAEKVGLQPENVLKAVEAWNALCDAGEGAPDLKFPAEWMHRIDTPPYYVFALGLYNCASGFGLRVDNYQRVLSAETDAPIEGLYAAYHTASGFCENSYAMSSVINNASLALWSGWRAANQILGIAED